VKNIFLMLLAFILGFGGVVGYQYLRSKQQMPIVTPEPAFILTPPSQAVSGTLTVVNGRVEKFSRGDTDFKEASTGAQILLGESIATKANASATVAVNDIVTMSMGPMAELVFANFFPKNFVLQQKSGKITYQVDKPISIRALHTLVSIDSGDVTINIIDTDASITVKTGTVKFALVDNDNNTKVWNLKPNQRANIDDEARTVRLIQAR
jgi:hypothetical protein